MTRRLLRTLTQCVHLVEIFTKAGLKEGSNYRFVVKRRGRA